MCMANQNVSDFWLYTSHWWMFSVQLSQQLYGERSFGQYLDEREKDNITVLEKSYF